MSIPYTNLPFKYSANWSKRVICQLGTCQFTAEPPAQKDKFCQNKLFEIRKTLDKTQGHLRVDFI